MNRLSLIGNLTRDPELRTVKSKGENTTIANFTVAASSGYGDHRKTVFVRISAWRNLGETCMKFLKQGSKVFVAGPVSANAYINKDSDPVASLELTLEEIEFLSSKPAETNETPVIDDDIDELL